VTLPGPRNPFQSPRFGQIATFMLLPAAADAAGLDVALLGVPYDGGTSYRSGARFGPRAVREQSSLIRPWNPVLKVHPFERLRVADCGDVDVVPISIERTFEAIERRIDAVVQAGAMPVCVGGDHSISLPILRSLARRHGPLGVVHFDAHPDTWDEYFGSKFFHGTPFRRAIEEGAVDGRRMIQVGIRGPLYGSEDFAFHDQHGIEVLRIEAVKEQGTAWAAERLARLRGGPVYCSFDIDAVDRTRDGHAGGRRAHVVRGAHARALAGGTHARGRGYRRGLAALRRSRPDHLAACRESHVRARQRARARSMSRRVSVIVLLALVVVVAAPAWAAPAPVATVVVDGVISPVTLRLVESAIARAKASGAQALVIQLDTPGGLERSMRAICQRLLNAELPVVVWVGPTGARAASAGVFITMAAHVASMAPATNIGAAHPVAVGGGVDKESMRKVENDAAAFIRTIALERGRNADWGEKAVRESVSVTERDAVRLKVVDFIADSIPDLLTKLDGRTVKTAQGTVTLATREAVAKPIEIGFRDRVLAIITDPNVAYVLMMLGTLGLIFELSTPGAILPGVIGGISLILAFFAFQSLPINFAGLLLILFAIVLFIAEVKVTSHGILAIGGIVSMALGSLMLYDAPEVGFRVSWRVIVPTVALTAGFFLFALTLGVRAFRRRPLLGVSGLVGQIGVARGALAPEGQVSVQGEVWRAVADRPLADGTPVTVVDVQGLTLRVVGNDVAGGGTR
jgi:membrane-bound serine protease (ClpP class)